MVKTFFWQFLTKYFCVYRWARWLLYSHTHPQMESSLSPPAELCRLEYEQVRSQLSHRLGRWGEADLVYLRVQCGHQGPILYLQLISSACQLLPSSFFVHKPKIPAATPVITFSHSYVQALEGESGCFPHIMVCWGCQNKMPPSRYFKQ